MNTQMRQKTGMTSKSIILIGISLCLMGCGGGGTLSGINTLQSLGKNMAAQEKAVQKETNRYEKLKKAILEGELKKGMPARKLIKRFGEPSVVLSEPNRKKYVYKPGDGSWFSGEKIYLYIDTQNTLVQGECLGFECPPGDLS